jgi:hypothetical protein
MCILYIICVYLCNMMYTHPPFMAFLTGFCWVLTTMTWIYGAYIYSILQFHRSINQNVSAEATPCRNLGQAEMGPLKYFPLLPIIYGDVLVTWSKKIKRSMDV